MEVLPILFLIIAIFSVVNRYKKAGARRAFAQKMRAARRDFPKRDELIQVENVSSEKIEKAHDVIRPLNNEIKKADAPIKSPSKAKLTVKDARRAVIMSEILSKPVSLRDE